MIWSTVQSQTQMNTQILIFNQQNNSLFGVRHFLVFGFTMWRHMENPPIIRFEIFTIQTAHWTLFGVRHNLVFGFSKWRQSLWRHILRKTTNNTCCNIHSPYGSSKIWCNIQLKLVKAKTTQAWKFIPQPGDQNRHRYINSLALAQHTLILEFL